MKAITNYVIALILVAIVLVIVGYLIFTYYNSFNTSGKYADCTAKRLFFCSQWQQDGAPPSGSWDKFAPGCRSAGISVDSLDECK